MQKIIILDNIRSAYNVGAIFRTADATAVEKIYLIGLTPTPIDRFGRIQTQISKTSLGASESVPWQHIGQAESYSTESLLTLIEDLQRNNFTVVTIEQAKHAQTLEHFTVPERVAYIFGAEVSGVQTAAIAAADVCVELPMLGKKESLNVSVVAGIVLFHRQ